MQTKFIEATNRIAPSERYGNWGKFAVCRFDPEEWARRAQVPDSAPIIGLSLLQTVGWGPEHVLVLDLQTGEGALFRHGGMASADLKKHRVWVCPLFEPFLAWLYQQDLADLDALPDYVDLADAPFALTGYRRPGRDG